MEGIIVELFQPQTLEDFLPIIVVIGGVLIVVSALLKRGP